MVVLIGKRTGVLVDTDGLPQDGIFDSIDAFWQAARPYDEKAVGALVHDDESATSSKDDPPGHRCQLAVLPDVGEAPADDFELYEPIAFSPTEQLWDLVASPPSDGLQVRAARAISALRRSWTAQPPVATVSAGGVPATRNELTSLLYACAADLRLAPLLELLLDRGDGLGLDPNVTASTNCPRGERVALATGAVEFSAEVWLASAAAATASASPLR